MAAFDWMQAGVQPQFSAKRLIGQEVAKIGTLYVLKIEESALGIHRQRWGGSAAIVCSTFFFLQVS